MKRNVSAHLELHAWDTADLILSVAVAASVHTSRESLRVVAGAGDDAREIEAREIVGRHGARLHRIEAPAGDITIDYEAEVIGQADSIDTEELDIIEYRRPSRYCESDTLFPTSRALFAGLAGKELVDAVAAWVGRNIAYVPGASAPTDGAVETMLQRKGVCRDFAHLVVALLRAHDVPARLVSVYAPGLSPMDFHAVAEVHLDGEWHIIDATGLAPRETMIRIATGSDASETAFLSQHGAAVNLRWMNVMAIADDLPFDNPTDLIELA